MHQLIQFMSKSKKLMYVRIPALMSWVSVSCRGSDTCAPRSVSLCECAVMSSLGRALFCPCVFCGAARSSCFYRLRAFMLCLVLCGTQFVYFMGCVLSCCHVLCEHVAYEDSHLLHVHVLFCTWLVICLMAMCLCFCFVWARGFCLSFLCAMCSHVDFLDPTHLVTWLLVNLPHLSSLVTLLICSLYNFLVFAILSQFVIISPWMYLAQPCPALSCPVLSCPVQPLPLPCSCFSPKG